MLLNLVGMGAPILLALFCIPPLIQGLGLPAFGLLTLVWVVLGYFSVFDLGIGRALTLALAQRRTQDQPEHISPLVVTGVAVTGLLGLAGAVLLASTAGLLAGLMTRSEPQLAPVAEVALYAIAAALPAVTMTAALRGVLEAHNRFGVTNAIRLAMGFITYGGPLLVLQFAEGLVPVVVFLTLARVLTCLAHFVAAWRVLPEASRSPRRWSNAELRPLLVSGGWMTCSNVISPLMSYLDRFVVAYVVGAGAVAYYTTPYEAISRLTVIAEAVLGVLFPALGAALATQPERARQLYAQGVRVMAAVMLPVAVTIAVFARDLLTLWISPDFAAQSFRVMQVLTLGVAVNCVARVTFTAVQSQGRADVTAKLHLFELPVFLVLLYGASTHYGIVGAACAWAIRAVLDFLLLLWIQHRLMPVSFQMHVMAVPAGVVLCTLAVLVGGGTWLVSGVWAAAGLALLALVASGGLVLMAADRRLLMGLRARLLPR